MSAGTTPPRVLVLGLGNVLMRDEGVGVRVIEALETGYRAPAGVELLDGGTSGIDLMDTVAGCGRLIVADAIASASAPPGSVLRLEGAEFRAWLRTRLSPHQFGLSDLLALLALSDQAPTRVTLFGIVPAEISLGLELSPIAAAAARETAARIAAELAAPARAHAADPAGAAAESFGAWDPAWVTAPPRAGARAG